MFSKIKPILNWIIEMIKLTFVVLIFIGLLYMLRPVGWFDLVISLIVAICIFLYFKGFKINRNKS